MQRPDAVRVILDIVEQGLRHDDRAVVRNAAAALAAIDEPRARQALQKLADGGDDAAAAALEAIAGAGAENVARWLSAEGSQSERWRALAQASERRVQVDGSRIPFRRRFALSFAVPGWGQRFRRGAVATALLAVLAGGLLSLLLLWPFLPDVPDLEDIRLRGLFAGLIQAAFLLVFLVPFVRTLDWRLGGWAFGCAQMLRMALAGLLAAGAFAGTAALLEGGGHAWPLAATAIVMLMLTRAASIVIARECRQSSIAALCQSALAAAAACVVLSTAATLGEAGGTAPSVIGLAAMVAGAVVVFHQADRHQAHGERRGTHLAISRTTLWAILALVGAILTGWVMRAADMWSQLDQWNVIEIDGTQTQIKRRIAEGLPLKIHSPYNQSVRLEAIADLLDDIRVGIRSVAVDNNTYGFSDKDAVKRGESITFNLTADSPKRMVVTGNMIGDNVEELLTSTVEWSKVFQLKGGEDGGSAPSDYLDGMLRIAIDELALRPAERAGARRPRAERVAATMDSWPRASISLHLIGDLGDEERKRVDAFDKRVREATTAQTLGNCAAVAGPLAFAILLEDVQVALRSDAAASRAPTAFQISAGSLIVSPAGSDTVERAITIASGRASGPYFADPGRAAHAWKVACSPDADLVAEGLAWSRRKGSAELGAPFESLAAREWRVGNAALAAVYHTGLHPQTAATQSTAVMLGGLGGNIEGIVQILGPGTRPSLVRVRPLHAWWLGPGQAPKAACFEVLQARTLQPAFADEALFDRVRRELSARHGDGPPAWQVQPLDTHSAGATACAPARVRVFFSADNNEHGLYEIDPVSRKIKHIGRSGVRSSTVGLASDPLHRKLIGSAWKPLLRIGPDDQEVVEFGAVGAEGLALDPHTRLLYASLNDSFFVLDVDEGSFITELTAPWKSDADCLATDEHRRIIYALGNASLIAYELDTRRSHKKEIGHEAADCGLAFDQVGMRLFASSVGEDARVLWEIDPETGKASRFATFDVELRGGLTAVVD